MVGVWLVEISSLATLGIYPRILYLVTGRIPSNLGTVIIRSDNKTTRLGNGKEQNPVVNVESS